MTTARSVFVAAAVLFSAHELRASPAPTAAPERAIAAVTELKVSLKKELEQAIAAGGPDSAINVCRERAPALAAEIGKKHDVAVGRSSHKLRNAKNAPRPWVQAAIDEWLKVAAADRKPRVVPVSQGVVGYVEPISTGALCLTCHGENVSESTRAKIKAAYPLDQAIGFKEGELRGVIWAEERSQK